MTKLTNSQLPEKEFLPRQDKSVEVSQELSEYSGDEYLADEAFLGEEPLFNKRSFVLILTSILAVLLLSGGILASLVYPSSQKVTGHWGSIAEGTAMELTVVNRQAVLAVGNLTLPSAMAVSFEGELQGDGLNSYKLAHLQAFVTAEKNDLADETINKLRENTELYKVVSETATSLRLGYTQAGLAHLLGSEQGERYFKFTREGVWFGDKPRLYLNNSRLAEARIAFEKID